MASTPIIRVVRLSAPRAALIVILAQLLGGAALAWALLLTNDVLQTLLALDAPAGFERLQAALPQIALLAAVLAARLGLETVTSLAQAHIAPKARRRAEAELVDATLSVELAAYEDPAFYDQLQRARDRGVQHLQSCLIGIIQVTSAALAVLGATAALFLLHPALAPLLLLALIPEAVSAMRAARIKYAGMTASIDLMRRTEMMADLATERAAAPEVRANQAERYVRAEHDALAEQFQDHIVGLGLREARILAVGRLLAGLGLLGAFVALAFMIQAGWIGLAAAGAAVIAIRTAGSSLSQLVLTAQELLEKALYISDFQEFLDEAKTRTRSSRGDTAPATPGRIDIRNVSFRYPGADGPPALRDITLSIEPGETVALVGENGSGKSTLAKLIAGLFQPTKGAIYWDGADMRGFAPESLANRVAMVLQDPIRWPRSARDNVRLGRFERDDPDDRHLLQAAAQARAADVIETLPDKWRTLLSRQFRGGHDLSTGQWQRLAVARGLYRDAPLVIWDEPTAPLDAKAEHAVYESLRQLAENRTVILITHRLASVRNADRIFFLDKGRLVEEGGHRELLARNGRYAELYRLQARLHRDQTEPA